MPDEVKAEETQGTEEEASVFSYDDDDWGDIEWGSDEGEVLIENFGEQELQDESEETDQSDEDESSEAEPETESNDEADDTDQWITLKHMDDEPRKVSKEEATILAQKGLDYDRIREERDNLKADLPRYQEMEKFLQEMQGDFDSIEEFMEDTRARVLADAEGLSYDEALERVHSAQKKTAEQKSESDLNIDAFIAKYPNVKAEEIPPSVWAEVRETGDLVSAYEKYDSDKKKDRIAELEQEVETLRQNLKNKSRSAGSSKSSGASNAKSLIDILWDDGN